MIIYLIESTVPETGEVRFYGKDGAFISADKPHRFVSSFAVDYGFRSFYMAELMLKKIPGEQKMVIRTDA